MVATPYLKPYEKINSVDRFFDYDAKRKCMTFVGTSLEIFIPSRYQVHNLLNLADTVTTLAVFDMVIDDRYQAGLLMLTTVEMEPDDVSTLMIGEQQYVKLTLSNGCKFIRDTERIADSSIVYSFWMEAVARGKLPYFIGYETLATLFDQAKSMCDQDINVDHVVFEVLYSHLARDPDNLTVQYRHTDMRQPYKFIDLRNVGYATTSTASRMMGSYFANALNSSLLQVTEHHSDFEDLLRS